MYSKYDFIKDLNPSKEEWRIKARVVRTWKVPNFQQKNLDDNVEMILLDEKGGRVHAAIKGSLNICNKIHEGEVYFIKKFGVGLNSGSFRPTKHDYLLSFNLRTDVKSTIDSAIPTNGFDFVDFDVIEKESSDSPYLVDVIGLVSGIGEVREHIISGRKTKMVVVELDNLRLSSDVIDSGYTLSQLSSQSSYSFENDFLKETERKCISDVKNCSEVTTCITYGTIKSIESKYKWWYKSCNKCPYSVYEDFEKWYCKNCQKLDDYYPKFCVQLRVVDHTDSASFILFDRDCVALLGMSAADLREQHFKRGDDFEHYRKELNVLIDKSMLFKDEGLFEKACDSVVASAEPKRATDVKSQTCDSADVGDISLSMVTPLMNPNDPLQDDFNSSVNRLVMDELLHDSFSLKEEHDRLLNSLTNEQRVVYDKIISAISAGKGGFFFLYGFGGTGKTFIWNTLSAFVRSRAEIVRNVASSGIASLLLPGGRTAHSRFRIPIQITEDSTCNIKENSTLAELL
ncbi:uncharacterized protein LOC133286069 [Gastrolobium bilobum]|uniref:uncharacterized protein LOC133286069 n=1 Tax=Gastrolobium bilobum TaxID=150636 RepID=UPI002AAF229A|nr:uncharacterized protein LOC133286069 [Gastrolobium bilobum]